MDRFTFLLLRRKVVKVFNRNAKTPQEGDFLFRPYAAVELFPSSLASRIDVVKPLDRRVCP